MCSKRRLFNFLVGIFIEKLALNKANKLSCSLSELLNPIFTVEHGGEKYFFDCPNNLTRWRIETYFSKEPETIEWIDSFKNNEILFDIGANIGLYSVYAAKRGIKVVAFEPESQNFALLNKNVYLNRLQDRITCLNIALSQKDSLDYLYIPFFQTGGAINCFGKACDFNGKDFNPAFKQGAISYSLDSFLSHYQNYFPTHIKIDVDGIEPDIIKGSEDTLGDKRLKSLLIEINESLPQDLELIEIIQSKGLSLIHKKHADMFKEGEYCKIFNYLFTRE